MSATFAAPKTNGADSRISVLLQGWGEKREKKKKERKKINAIRIVSIMTFILILDVMTTIFAACTAMILIRMETALLINLLFEKDYLISLYSLCWAPPGRLGVACIWLDNREWPLSAFCHHRFRKNSPSLSKPCYKIMLLKPCVEEDFFFSFDTLSHCKWNMVQLSMTGFTTRINTTPGLYPIQWELNLQVTAMSSCYMSF